MTKQEALEAVKAEGSLGRTGRTPAWEKAFKAYNEAHPNDQLNGKCGSCYRKVAKWMQS